MKTKQNFFKWIISIALVIGIGMPILAGCDSNKYTVSVTMSSGGTVEGAGKYKKNDKVTLKAIPKEYYEFMGWVESNNLDDVINNPLVEYFSHEAIIEFTAIKDTSFVAIFKGNPLKSFDRILTGANAKYGLMMQNKSSKLSFDTSVYLDFKFNEIDNALRLTFNIAGNIDLVGSETEILLSLIDEKNSIRVLDLYYTDAIESGSAKLYVGNSETKQIINFPTVSDFKNMFAPAPVQANMLKTTANSWTIESLLKELFKNNASADTIIDLVLGLLGPDNSLGFFGNITNTESATEIDVYLNSVLTYAKILLGTMTDSSMQPIKDIFDALTASYPFNNFPRIKLSLKAGFVKTNDVEVLNSFAATLYSNKDYQIGGDAIPALTLNVGVNKLDFAYVQDKFTKLNFSDAGYVATEQKLLNYSVFGTMAFSTKTETGTTVDKNYKISIYTDIDPIAFLPAISLSGFDFTKINWTNVGLFQLKITDVATTLDYINVYLDTTSTIKPMLFVRANFIENLKISGIPIPVPLNINTSYDLLELIEYIKNPKTTKVPTTPAVQSLNALKTTSLENTNKSANVNEVMATATSTLNLDFVATIVKLIPSVINTLTGNMDLGELLVQISQSVVGIIPDTAEGLPIDLITLKKVLAEDISYDKTTGLNVKLENLKKVLSLDVGMAIDLGPVLFGSNNHLTVKMDKGTYGGTKILTENNVKSYVNEENVKLIDVWNSHKDNTGKVILKINSITEIDNKNFLMGKDLETYFGIGVRLNANVTFSDGTNGTYPLTIAKVDYNQTLETTGNKTAKIYFRCAGSPLIESALWTYVPLPIGVYTYDASFNVIDTLVDNTDIKWNIPNLQTNAETGENFIANYVGTSFSGSFGEVQHLESIKENIVATGDTFTDANNLYLEGKFSVTLSAFGLTKNVKLYNYKVANAPAQLDVLSVDAFADLKAGVQATIGEENLEIGSISVRPNDGSTLSSTLTSTVKTLSKDLTKYLLANRTAQLIVNYSPSINGVVVSNFAAIRAKTFTVNTILPVEVITKTQYYSQTTYKYMDVLDLFFKINLQSNLDCEIFTASPQTDDSGLLDYSSHATGTYKIDGNKIVYTIGKTEYTGTLENGVASINGYMKIETIECKSLTGKYISTNANIKALGDGVFVIMELGANNTVNFGGGGYQDGIITLPLITAGTSVTYEYNPLSNKIIFYVTAKGADKPTIVEAAITDGVLSVDLTKFNFAYISLISNSTTAQFKF